LNRIFVFWNGCKKVKSKISLSDIRTTRNTLQMKRLILVRHAKAEQGGYSNDFARELTDRGKNDARTISSDMKRREIIPDYIITSPAKRALTTARIFAEETGFDKSKIVEQKGLYFDYTTNDFIEMLNEIDDKYETVAVFGHNPFIYFMAENLCQHFGGDMPTCSTIVIDFDISSWKKVEARQGKLIIHLYPSQY